MNLVTYLRDKGIPVSLKEKNNAYVECPWCGHETVSINVHNGVWQCWHADCTTDGKKNRAGPFTKLLEQWNMPAPAEGFSFREPPKEDKTLTEEDRNFIISCSQNKAEVIEWAASRSLDGAAMLKLGIGWDKTQNAVVFPFHDEKGKLIGAKFRSQLGQWIKGEEPKLYAPNPKDIRSEKVVVVEGEVDALTLRQFGVPVVATLGAGKTKGLKLLSGTRKIYLGYDMDPAGDTGCARLLSELGSYRCARVTWGDKDPNDWLQSGAAKEQIIQAIKDAKPCTKDTASISALDALGVYFDEHEKGLRPRRSWGYERLDTFTRGIGGGELVGILAESGTGKTTFILNVLSNHVAQGIKVGFASLEEHPIHEITPKLYSVLLGRNISKHGMSKDDARHIEKELSMVQLYNKKVELDEVLDWVKECYFLHDVKCIAIDYFQLLVHDEESVQDIKDTIFKIKDLTKEMPDLCILLVIQPKQKQRGRTKDGKEAKPMKLEGADARGGSAINQTIDKMLTICGVPGHPNITQYEYTKARGHLNVSKRDWLNKFTQLEYNHDTLRMTEIQAIVYGSE
jgi:archaellum biogenesis ATPase FlaH/5S rRNA maturation endonuclease (ribonuclease M5)